MTLKLERLPRAQWNRRTRELREWWGESLHSYSPSIWGSFPSNWSWECGDPNESLLGRQTHFDPWSSSLPTRTSPSWSRLPNPLLFRLSCSVDRPSVSARDSYLNEVPLIWQSPATQKFHRTLVSVSSKCKEPLNIPYCKFTYCQREKIYKYACTIIDIFHYNTLLSRRLYSNL